MSKLERVDLFNRKSGLLFTLFLLIILSLSLSYEYFQFTKLKTFDDPLVRASVIDQEVRMIGDKPKTSIKLRLENGTTVRCAMSPYVRDLRGREVLVELQVAKVTFLEYLRGIHTRGVIVEVYPSLSLKERWYRTIASSHEDSWMKELYGALFVATPMSYEFQSLIGGMGLSAAISISGYHFAILSMIGFFLLRPVYRAVHNRYFPYRHGNRDIYFVILIVLGFYLWALEFNPAMVRSFGMIAVGYWFYDRGVKIISFQTLFVTIGLLLAFFPKLFFSMGFWFSVYGVLLIFIFIRYYEHWKGWQIFLALNVWLYITMLPISLSIFGTFSWIHASSIVLNILFNVYYPLVLILHGIGQGELLDPYLLEMFERAQVVNVTIAMSVGWLSVVLALGAIWRKEAFWSLGFLGIATFGSAVYQIA
ncbi:ComEC/Rec2 family competence protein [Sulfuricurvum sp.]|uniref:ComEC/Rec2 family competence protein n=1 Tax=Sulfuricurvum sp. TaxID=2025608 RepID=UPI0019A05D77|nr:ComEC/Rec2 family competence protein [Sulfuricurvum sp.]MBD3806080.1 ComEC/Rec2 family competence protein [Sulfuricurvum sp.]